MNSTHRNTGKLLTHVKDAGSALVVTLSGLAILTALAVTMLTTSKIEQTAANNQSGKSQLNGFTKIATEQAIKKLEDAFNASPEINLQGEYAEVITTQPGRVTKSFFQDGSRVLSATASQELFTAYVDPALAVNLNNLESPYPVAQTSTDEKHSITGSPSTEQLLVGLSNMNENGQGGGNPNVRIAYYIDDESTKINLNALTRERRTINPSMEKVYSATALTSDSTTLGKIDEFALGNAAGGVGRIFSTDQAMEDLGLNKQELAKSSIAPLSDYHNKYTPWGTDRVFINDLPIDESGVNAIYEALSGRNATTLQESAGDPSQYELTGRKLREVYGTTFAEKYTDAGLKQIAANILQARDPDTLNNWNKSFSYNGSLLGAEAEATDTTTGLVAIADCCSAVKKVIPKDYMGVAPYPFINELGVTVVWTCEFAGGRFIPRLNIRPFISIVNLNRISMAQSNVDEWEIEMQIDSFQYDVTDSNGNTYTYGPSGFENGDAWGHTWAENLTNARTRDSSRGGGFAESYLGGSGPWSYRLSGFSNIGGTSYTTSRNRAPDWGRTMTWSQEWQFPCPPYPNTNWSLCAQFNVPNDGTQILDIDNFRIKFEYIRLIAKSGDDTTIRDWVLAEDTEYIQGWLQAPHPYDAGVYPNGWPVDLNAQKITSNAAPNGQKTNPLARNQTLPPPRTVKRIDGRLRTTASMADRGDIWMQDVQSTVNYLNPWGGLDDQSWIDANAGEIVREGYAQNQYNSVAYPQYTRGNQIPGDQTQTDVRLFFAYDPAWHHVSSTAWPSIQFTNQADLKRPDDTDSAKGVFTVPADLGKIQTNVRHRKLRMTTQHPNEVRPEFGGVGNATFIPDWAMLDVVSFGTEIATSNNTYSSSAPVNFNAAFHVPAGNTQPAARTAGIDSMVKQLDALPSAMIGNLFNGTETASVPTRGNGPYHDAAAGLSATLVDNVKNLTWTSGNQKFYNASYTSTWGYGGENSRRSSMGFPNDLLILPSEVTEISGISDFRYFDRSGVPNVKGNEGRLSAFFPGATTQSRFFTIYAYAQKLDRDGNIDSQQVTRTLVEVKTKARLVNDGENPFNPPKYEVEKISSEIID